MRLSYLLSRAGITAGADAHHVCFRGPLGEATRGDGAYGTSIPLSKAMDSANDIIVAYKQNGR